MTPVRVVCQNTLNLAFRTAKRTWTARHTSNIKGRIEDARATLQFAEKYMAEMGKGSKGTASGTVKKMGALGAVFCCLFQFMHTADFRPPVERRLAC